MEKITQNLEEFEAEATRFAASLTMNQHKATLITLSGELGAGKTAFTKVIARVFGVEDTVTSPTFVLEKIYQLASSKPFERLIHIDAYRLEQGSDLAPLGFDESMKETHNLIILEWPERVADALPTPVVNISIKVLSDNARKIIYA